MIWPLLLILCLGAALIGAAVIDGMVALIKRKRNKKLK
jgi:hypothetical protein